jgi:nucleoside diphosphate kinase
MTEELSYVIVTPYSIRKSRTGGIVARLILRTGLDLVAARMFAPSKELTEKYAEGIVTAEDPVHRSAQELIRKYVLNHFQPDGSGFRPRVMLLVFRGENAVAKIRNAVGHILYEATAGETIRDTFGDYVANEQGDVTYFEPGVLAPQDVETCERDLKLWAEYSDSDGGLLEGVVQYTKEAQVQRTLVLIKPDNFRFPSGRPGSVMDVFSRTGLYIIGIKVHRMSVAQAEEFYGPVLGVLQKVFCERTGKQARLAIEDSIGIELDADIEKKIGDLLGPLAGRSNWESIIQFMAGLKPGDCPDDQRNAPGSEKCIALVYEGVDAVRKIREVLGPTDPSKAPPGSIRREFGQNIMVNAAHASDAPENAAREMGIIKITENNLKPLIESHYANK